MMSKYFSPVIFEARQNFQRLFHSYVSIVSLHNYCWHFKYFSTHLCLQLVLSEMTSAQPILNIANQYCPPARRGIFDSCLGTNSSRKISKTSDWQEKQGRQMCISLYPFAIQSVQVRRHLYVSKDRRTRSSLENKVIGSCMITHN